MVVKDSLRPVSVPGQPLSVPGLALLTEPLP